ncbi:hypothetical protein [Jannaschia formosa]|uniref:hypothetical protein n=1 Tax=Jannaschia formosa TaxID=2259592 RepID=UPI000E1B8328|nr:hypothetical protein [Jannaschia formosa]TFL19324.1 hypothetical protein DR046_05210 [Jannaschia formosa]
MSGPGRRARARLASALRWIDRQAARAGYYPRMGAFPFLDYALPVLPNQILLLVLACLHRERWLAIALTFAIASALGAVAVTLVVQIADSRSVARFLTGEIEAAGPVIAWIEAEGVWVLAALALLPTPPRSAVLVCALAGLPPVEIGGAIAAGRACSASAMAWLAARGSRRLPPLARWLDRIEDLRMQSS